MVAKNFLGHRLEVKMTKNKDGSNAKKHKNQKKRTTKKAEPKRLSKEELEKRAFDRKIDYQKKQVSLGNCRQCGKKAIEGMKNCSECREKNRERARALYRQRNGIPETAGPWATSRRGSGSRRTSKDTKKSKLKVLHNTSVILPQQMVTAVESLAEKQGCSRAELLREIITSYLKKPVKVKGMDLSGDKARVSISGIDVELRRKMDAVAVKLGKPVSDLVRAAVYKFLQE